MCELGMMDGAQHMGSAGGILAARVVHEVVASMVSKLAASTRPLVSLWMLVLSAASLLKGDGVCVKGARLLLLLMLSPLSCAELLRTLSLLMPPGSYTT
jgi:hypothetical protein